MTWVTRILPRQDGTVPSFIVVNLACTTPSSSSQVERIDGANDAEQGATCSPLDHNAGEARRRERV